jgi:hypothetical protein
LNWNLLKKDRTLLCIIKSLTSSLLIRNILWDTSFRNKRSHIIIRKRFLKFSTLTCLQLDAHQVKSKKSKKELLILMCYEILNLETCKNSLDEGIGIKMREINSFDLKRLSWESMEFVEDYKDLNQCEISVTIPMFLVNSDSIWVKRNKFKKNKAEGITISLLEVMEEKFNFQMKLYDGKNLCEVGKGDKFQFCARSSYASEKMNFKNDIHIRKTPPISYGHLTFLVSHGQQYTPFEKLFLPFDLFTWIMIIITFFIGYFTILIIYQFPQNVQNFVFGRNNRQPSLSLTQIFFGIGLIRTPGRNFARFIFISFTLYCLIIRTAYQGKMFEFLHSNAEKPVPKTMQELIDQQTPVLIMDELETYFNILSHDKLL